MGQATEEERTADRLQILMNQEVESFWESYQKSVQNDKNPQWKEKIKTVDDKIVLAVDPKSTEEEGTRRWPNANPDESQHWNLERMKYQIHSLLFQYLYRSLFQWFIIVPEIKYKFFKKFVYILKYQSF